MPKAQIINKARAAGKSTVQDLLNQGNFRTVVKLARGVGEGELPEEIHVARTGKYDKGGFEFEFQKKHFEEMVANFNADHKDVAITAGHDFLQESPAAGWIKELEIQSAGDDEEEGPFDLVATRIKWTRRGKDLLSNEEFKFFSGEFSFDSRDEHGRLIGATMFGGALTNKPFLSQLEPLMASRISSQLTNSHMNTLEEILEKDPQDLTPEEINVLKEHKAELNSEQLETYKDVLEDEGAGSADTDQGDDTSGSDQGTGDAGATEEGDAGTGSGEGGASGSAEGDTDQSGSGGDTQLSQEGITHDKNGNVILSKQVWDAISRQANEGHQANLKLQRMEVEKQVDALVLSADNPNGKILHRDRKQVTEFMQGLTEAQQKQFTAILSNIPGNSKLMSKEMGSSGSNSEGGESVQDKLHREATKLSKQEGIEYTEAVRKVSAREDIAELLKDEY